jgi:hypothetical protein
MPNLGTCLLILLLAIATPPPKQQPVGHTVDLKKETGDSDVPPNAPKPITPVEPMGPKVEIPTNRQNKLLQIFASYVGIKEQPMGSNNGPMVNKFNASCGLDPSEHAPWCAAVAHYGYLQIGLKAPGAYSPSWFTKSRAISRDKVVPGDVGLIYFASKGRYAHTIAAIEKATFSAGRVVQVTTLEGNTNAQGSREGDQFARRIRPADTVQFVRWWNM